MSLIRRAVKRIEPRVQVLPIELRGTLVIEDGGQERQTPFFVWDISITGLGIIVSDRLLPGETIQLNIASPFPLSASCSVVWCEIQHAEYDFQEPSYRAGLVTIDHDRPLQPLIDALDGAVKDKK